MTKKRFFEEAGRYKEPAKITIMDDSAFGNYKFVMSLDWCNGLFIRDIYRTNRIDKLRKIEAKFNRWLAEYKKA
jgi:hypothetical protein